MLLGSQRCVVLKRLVVLKSRSGTAYVFVSMLFYLSAVTSGIGFIG